MTQQPSATDVFVRGGFNGWGTGNPLVNDGTGIYTGTVSIADAPGSVELYKFYFDPGGNWESPASTCGDNRTFTLAAGAQTLPVVYYNDAPPVLPNNDVTFQLDMSAQVLTGAFTNGLSVVRVSGAFNGWGAGDQLTNNPAVAGIASNIYTGTFNVAGVPGACAPFKYRADGGWESPASTGGNNRTFKIAGGGGTQTLPLVFYNDSTVCDLVQSETPVTFVLQMTNGTPSADGGILFDRSVNKVYLNAEFLGWWAWNTGFGGSEGPQFEMTNNPAGSDFFQQTFVIPKGKGVGLTYKYGIDGFDNEAAVGVNHIRFIRSLPGVAYTMPTDRFGTNVSLPVVEKSFGNLQIGTPAAGKVLISWDGRQCVTLQTKSTVEASLWQDITLSDGTSSTNWPIGTTPQFFRLQKRQ